MCLGGDEDVEAVVDLYLVETISTANIIKKVESKGGMVVMSLDFCLFNEFGQITENHVRGSEKI